MKRVLCLRTLQLRGTNQPETKTFSHSIRQHMTNGEHLHVLMDANPRSGRRVERYAGNKAVGAYGRDTLNDNGQRLLAFSAEYQLSLPNSLIGSPPRGIAHIFHNPNIGKDRHRLDYLLTRRIDRRLVRNVTARRFFMRRNRGQTATWSQQTSVYWDALPLTAARERRRADGRPTSNT